MVKVLPVITLYQPWATWIMRGWKTIETRTHNRFASLAKQTILIHAGLKTDPGAILCPYLSEKQLKYNPDEMVNGYILGSAFVKLVRPLEDYHSKAALIDCEQAKRFGLFLTEIDRWEVPIKEKGEMGIWYYDIEKRIKVRKPKIEVPMLF